MAPPFVQSSTACNGSNDPLGSTSLENFFLGFGSPRVVLGARVSFGITSHAYIGPRVAFG